MAVQVISTGSKEVSRQASTGIMNLIFIAGLFVFLRFYLKQYLKLELLSGIDSLNYLYKKLGIKADNKTIWTIGHSTRSFEELIAMLHSFNIKLIADVRSYPGSRRCPQFNKELLKISLPQKDIQYVHLNK